MIKVIKWLGTICSTIVIITRYYLEEAEWNDSKAARDYEDDIKWEK